ncbi:MAG: ABC transporter ATP-binding protein, partial [Clostridia bacterium]|nr:ABC transporter ATP-binding protein [Clostridia bacterium]
MLTLKGITKQYVTGDTKVDALKGIDIEFRSNEFVSILGPSGCGKTTLLNIIGGLDRYTDGDLTINGRSTKEYKDSDWDTYRNHSIGFVFQSYNLIPHQSVLQNVELALTLSGVSKNERKARAIKALQEVGLGDQINKKPSEMSGGQMQRVAIARALVNNPDIILADEPTGALDTETSVQVMDILKKISEDKLIIMVTHNPEIAEKYSSRIIKILDGNIIDDSNPYTQKTKVVKEDKANKTSMNFLTALSLSFKNLLTKKGRTILTSFAGSIGIIGIAMILAISNGVQAYIDSVQEDTLSSFPIQIEKESTDMTAMMETMIGVQGENTSGGDASNRDAVYGNPVMYKMMKSMLNADVNTNNLKDFKVYIDKNKETFSEYSNAIQYGYKIKLNIYATDPNGEYAKADFADLMDSVMEGSSMMSSVTSVLEKSGGVNVWQELITDPQTGEISNLITEQYDLIYGTWPKEKNEILLVLNENNEISDVTLHSLGLVDKQTMVNATIAAMMGKEDHGWDEYEGKSWSYEEICNIPLKMVLPTDYYQYDESLKLWVDISDNDALLNSVINKGMTMNIVGIIKPSEDATAPFLSSSLCYTSALTQYYIDEVNNSEIVKQQKENTQNNILSGLPFEINEENELTDEEKIQEFKDYVAELTDGEKATLYEKILAKPKDDFVNDTVDNLLKDYENKSAEEIVNDIKSQYAGELGYSEELINNMLSGYEKEELIDIIEATVKEMIVKQFEENAADTIETIASKPSNAELSKIKNMIYAEMYKDIANLPEPQLTVAKQQINMGYVAQNWSSKTGMSMENAMTILATMTPEDFQKAFNTTIDESATQMYYQYGTTSSNADKNAKIAKDFDSYLKTVPNQDYVYFYENHMPDKLS